MNVVNNPFSFIYSIENNSIDTLRDLIKERNDLIFIDNDGNTIFHHIISMDVPTHNKIELIDLINEKTDLSILEIKNKKNKSSWDYAKDMEDKEIYKHLLLIDDFCGGSIEQIKERIKERIKYGIDINTINKRGDSLLHLMVKKENVDITKLLLENKADVNKTNSFSDTPLQQAVSCQNIDITRLLLENKADINKVDFLGKPLLFWPINNNNINLTKLLLESKADANQIDERKKDTPLNWAISNNNVKITELLLENKADIEKKCGYRNTPLHWAILKDNVEITELLLENKADINKTNMFGETPLESAITHKKNIKIQRILLTQNKKDGCIIL